MTLAKRITDAAALAVGQAKYPGVVRPKWIGPTHIDARYGRAAVVAALKTLRDDTQSVVDLDALIREIEGGGP